MRYVFYRRGNGRSFIHPMRILTVMPCLECSSPLAKGKHPKRFCGRKCQQAFNNRRAMRGALLYDLYYANRVDRSKATELKVRRAMDRLVIRWRDEDAGRKTYKPIMMALADIEALDRPPATNLYEIHPPSKENQPERG